MSKFRVDDIDKNESKLLNRVRTLYQNYKINEFEIEQIETKLHKYEPLLIPSEKRFVLYPIEYLDIWDLYKKHQSTYWIAEELDFSKDIIQWNSSSVSDGDRFFLKHIFAFFASFDGIINENLVEKFYDEIQVPEARCFYGFQIMIENIHNEVYSLLIDKFADDENEKSTLLNSIKNFSAIQKMAKWALDWIKSDKPFYYRILKAAFTEGIFFSGAFCPIFYFKKRGLFGGLTFANELISRDESLHVEGSILMYNHLKYRLPEIIVHNIAKEVVELSCEFITESLPCDLIGMNKIEMTKYIKYVTDRLLVQLNYNKLYNIDNPFPWMDLISTEVKTNFFEKKVSMYSKSKIKENDGNN